MQRPMLSSKPVMILFFFVLAVTITQPIIHPFQVANAQSSGQSQYFTEFAWDYGGSHWDWNLSIPAALYEGYAEVPDSVRTQYGLTDFGVFTSTYDSYMQTLASLLNASATQSGYGRYDEVNFVLAFVQSIPYKTDNASTPYQDYPRFPVETLVDDVGDCKSHSILFATLMLILGYDTVFINPPNHLAVGILGNNLPGSYFTFSGKTYYYCETTGTGFTIGELPSQFNNITAGVYSIDQSEQYIPNLQENSLSGPTPFPLYSATPTFNPNPLASSSPTMGGPTIQPDRPMSLNLISAEPVLFILIIFAIAVSITAAIMSTNKSKQKPIPNQTLASAPNNATPANSNMEINKFCIFCGSSNKSIAVYCEKCGKKIG